jgi:O-antigen/teichoic acid export membrane protein
MTSEPKPTTKSGRRPHSTSRNMLTSFVGNLFPPMVSLVSGPIMAHALGVEGRGEVAAATAPMTLVVTAVTFGIPEALTYTVARNPGLVRSAMRRGLLLLSTVGFFAMVAVFFSRGWLSGGNDAVAKLSTIACLIIIPALCLSVVRGIAAAHNSWGLIATERILASTTRLMVIIPLAFLGLVTPLTATLIIATMPVVGALSYLRLPRSFEPEVEDTEGVASSRRLLSYGLRIWIGSISGILLSRVDQTLMTPLANTYELGLYVVAVNVSELLLIINSSVRDVSFASDAREAVDERLAAAARISSTVCILAALALGFTMVWWLPLLFGEAFRPAVPVAAVALAAVALGTPGSIGGSGLGARGRPGLRSMSLVVACLVNVVMLIFLLPTMGAMGAAIATLVGNLISSNLNLYFMQRVFGIPMHRFYGIRVSDFAMLKKSLLQMISRS